jgi:drug/metabolite transporter (DMT)-like permease
MIELWVPITLAAAFLQCVRTAMQKHLSGILSPNAATFIRYFYGVPVAALYLAGLLIFTDFDLPGLNPVFALHCAVAGLAQIVATSLLIQLFSLRNFAVGTTYSKTEAVQTAIFGIVILGEPVSTGGFFAILVSMAGVMLLSWVRGQAGAAMPLGLWTDRGALIGILAGGLFGITAVSIRAAALSLGGEGFLLQAAFTLAVMTVFQTLVLSVYLALREPSQLFQAISTWRRSALVGLFGVLGSICWFSAMTLQNAAYVRTLGQVELVFTFIASAVFFKERSTRLEIGGILLIVLGVVLLLNFR